MAMPFLEAYYERDKAAGFGVFLRNIIVQPLLALSMFAGFDATGTTNASAAVVGDVVDSAKETMHEVDAASKIQKMVRKKVLRQKTHSVVHKTDKKPSHGLFHHSVSQHV